MEKDTMYPKSSGAEDITRGGTKAPRRPRSLRISSGISISLS